MRHTCGETGPAARPAIDAEPSAAALPAWQEINHLFAKHGLLPPPIPLRDQLVMHLLAYKGDRP